MSIISKKSSLVCATLAALFAVNVQANIDPQTLLKKNTAPKVLPEDVLNTLPTTPNPYISLLENGTSVDDNYWNMRNFIKAQKAAANNKAAKIKVTGNKGAGTITLSKFGTGKSQSNTAQVTGSNSLPAGVVITQNPEDEGSIPLATETNLISGNSVSVNGTIGDGQFGASGTGSGDFDFYAIRDVSAGDQIVVEVNTDIPLFVLDPAVALYDSEGNILAFNDDSRGTYDSFVTLLAPADGDYFVSIGTFGNSILLNPFESGSGQGVDFTFGVANEGTYSASISVNYFEEQLITFTAKKGDVIGAALNGVLGELALIDNSDINRQGSQSPANSSFDTGTPLPAGAVSVGHVVDRPSLFTLRVRTFAVGDYTVDVGSYLPELKTASRGDVQTLFIDFDGASVDLSESVFKGVPFPIIRNLSPLSAFLAQWGLTPADEDAVIDSILERVEDSLVRDLEQLGPNPKFAIRLLNSRDHVDPWGDPNVSRVIVGGTRNELQINTIGIAQSIDVGNYDTEETAFVLLDLLSGLAPSSIDLNNIPRAVDASIIDIIGVGVGEIVAHEAGHYLGSWHTDQFNDVANIMDQGGNLEFSILGLGPDGIFGSEDDTNVQFVRDVFNPNESFTGIEDTQSTISFGSTQSK